MNKKDTYFLLGMVLAMMCWGISWPMNKIIAQYGDLYALTSLRFFLTSVTVALIVVVSKQSFKIKTSGISFVLLAVLFMMVYQALFYTGLQQGLASIGGVLVTTFNPIVAFVIGAALFKRQMSTMHLLGLGLGLVGLVVQLALWENYENIFARGNHWYLLAAAVWAFLSITTSSALKFGSVIGFSFWLYFIVSFVLFFVPNQQAWKDLLNNADAVFWLNILFCGPVTTGLATTYYFYATTKIGPEKASVFMFVVPLCAAFGSLWILAEPIAFNTILGGLLGVISVYIIQRKKS